MLGGNLKSVSDQRENILLTDASVDTFYILFTQTKQKANAATAFKLFHELDQSHQTTSRRAILMVLDIEIHADYVH